MYTGKSVHAEHHAALNKTAALWNQNKDIKRK